MAVRRIHEPGPGDSLDCGDPRPRSGPPPMVVATIYLATALVALAVLLLVLRP